MKRIIHRTLGLLTTLVMLLLVPVSMVSAEEELSPFLTITADSTFVYAKAKAENPVCTLRKDQLCGMVAEAVTEDGAWYSVICINESRNGCFGYIPKDSARRLTMAEFNALMEDIDRANEVMDLINAINQAASGEGGNGAAADGIGTGDPDADGKNASADMGTIRELYENAMQALSSFSSGDLTSALEEVKKMQSEALDQAVNTGTNLIGTAVDGLSDQASKAANQISELTEKAQKAMENLQESLGALGDAGEKNLSALEQGFTDARADGEEALKDVAGTVSGKAEELASEASNLLNKVVDTYLPAIGAEVNEIGDAYKGMGFLEGAQVALSKVEHLLSLFANE